jgi:hypothetical protein
VQRARVQHGHERNRDQVVGNHRGREEDSQVNRHAIAEHHQQGDGKRGIGRDGHPPDVAVGRRSEQ